MIAVEETSDHIGQLIAAAAEFYRRGWVLGTSGNFSSLVSREPFRICVTASGNAKGDSVIRTLLNSMQTQRFFPAQVNHQLNRSCISHSTSCCRKPVPSCTRIPSGARYFLTSILPTALSRSKVTKC